MKPANKYFALVVAMAAALASCSDSESDALDIPNKYNLNIIEIPTISEISLSSAETEITRNISDFGMDLFKSKYSEAKLQSSPNVSVSPLSLITCLSLSANAFDIDFKEAVKNLTGCSDIAELNDYMNKIMRFLPDKVNGCELSLANSVWYLSSYSPSANFVDCATKNYFAELIGYDHKDDIVDMINNWCNIKTKGMIPNFFSRPPDGLEILNALYFYGEWETKFDKNLTRKQTFHGINRDCEVSMMSGKFKNVSYRRSKKGTAVYLPYKGDYYMILVLPEESVTTEDVADALLLGMPETEDGNAEWIADTGDGNISMPKFKVSYGNKLNDFLEAIGFPSHGFVPAFDMIAEHISYLQKTVVEVDEEGTRAAAVSASIVDSAPINIVFDRPFLYSIVNKTTGLSLITGYVGDPSEAE